MKTAPDKMWTLKEIRRLEDLLATGAGLAAIAAQLGRTRTSVRGQVDRRGLCGIIRAARLRRWIDVLAVESSPTRAAKLLDRSASSVHKKRRLLAEAGFQVRRGPKGGLGGLGGRRS